MAFCLRCIEHENRWWRQIGDSCRMFWCPFACCRRAAGHGGTEVQCAGFMPPRCTPATHVDLIWEQAGAPAVRAPDFPGLMEIDVSFEGRPVLTCGLLQRSTMFVRADYHVFSTFIQCRSHFDRVVQQRDQKSCDGPSDEGCRSRGSGLAAAACIRADNSRTTLRRSHPLCASFGAVTGKATFHPF